MIIKEIFIFLKKNKLGLGILFLSWGIFFIIFWSNMLFYNGNGDLVAGWKYIWADWAMHLSLTNAFYYQPIIYVINNNPLYSGSKLGYPFIVNLIGSSLMKMGVNLISAMILPSILYSWLILFGMYLLGLKITKSIKKTLIGITIFFCSGGLGFRYYFYDLKNTWDLKNIFPLHEYTNLPEKGIFMQNFFLSHLVPQRAFLLGMIMGLFILRKIYDWYLYDFKKENKSSIFICGVMTGSLIYIHTHSLIFLFLLCGFLFFSNWKNWKSWFIYAGGALLMIIPYLWVFRDIQNNNLIHWLPGWLANYKEHNINIIWFWLNNWGLFLPLAFYGILKSKEKKKKCFLTAFLGIFIISNFVIYQPSSWDNGKLFLWIYLILAFVVGDIIVEIGKIKRWGKLVAFVLFITLILAGGLDIIKIMNKDENAYVMIDKNKIELAKLINSKTKYNDIFLTSDWHLHWIPVMSGRSIVMGYRGWLWSYGIDYRQRENDIGIMVSGSYEGRKLMNKYGINYVVIDKELKDKYSVNENYFLNNYKLMVKNGDINVFKVK